MNTNPEALLLQYHGYLKTPLLWTKKPVLELQQMELPEGNIPCFNHLISENVPIGKRVEQFLFGQLSTIEDIDMLLQNVQIREAGNTLGEIDCLFLHNKVPVHLEIAYKFYLYDPEVGTTEFDHWVGPNRKDNLFKKLLKLKNHQMPLIRSNPALNILHEHDIKEKSILQKVYFKAQLFTPYQQGNVPFQLLNRECVKGFYIRFSEMDHLSGAKFHIPERPDWLLEARPEVNWLSFQEFKDVTNPLIRNKRSPLCWIKFPDGRLQKFFAVWWE